MHVCIHHCFTGMTKDIHLHDTITKCLTLLKLRLVRVVRCTNGGSSKKSSVAQLVLKLNFRNLVIATL